MWFMVLLFPIVEADKILLRLAAESTKSAKVIGKYAVHRMVLGPKGFGDLNDKIRMDFAEPMLKLDMDRKLISYLGKIHEARALRALMYCLEKGVNHAANALVASAEGLSGPFSKIQRLLPKPSGMLWNIWKSHIYEAASPPT